MSNFEVKVVQIGEIERAPNSDELSITMVDGAHPCIFRTGDFNSGDYAIYIPVEAIINSKMEWTKHYLHFLKWNSFGQHKVKAVKIRGTFSMGLLSPVPEELGPPSVLLGNNVATALGIEKWEEPEPMGFYSDCEQRPEWAPPTYDIESYRKYKHLLREDEMVWVTEKLHGVNAGFTWREDRLWVASHKTFRKDGDCVWWRMAKVYSLEEKLKKLPNISVFGEIYGWVQDIKYGATPNETWFAAFDMWDTDNRNFLPYEKFLELCAWLNIPHVPILYHGQYNAEIEALATGKSELDGKSIREGIVIRPEQERWSPEIGSVGGPGGRVCFKLLSEDYLTRKNGTERH